MKSLKIILATENLTAFEDTFAELATIIVKGLKGSETPSKDILKLSFNRWQVQCIPYSTNSLNSLKELIIAKQLALGYKVLEIKIDSLQNLSQANEFNQEVDLQIENIHISNQPEKLQNSKNINIFMEQSLGFGTGKHETTYLCLQLLIKLAKKEKILKMLDLGTGSGILAIATAKLWKTEVLAVDMDKLALDTTKKFIKLNQVDNLVKTLFSNGFQEIPKQKFNLIMANILLNPLIVMADDFYNYTEKQGFLILSGILNSQSSALKTAFNKWEVLVELQKNNWSALLLQKC